MLDNYVKLIFREIRECLKLDADHKQCHSHYKIVKKIERLVVDSQSAINIKDFASSIQFSKKVILIFFF
jgi:DnaJ family protein C protein 3